MFKTRTAHAVMYALALVMLSACETSTGLDEEPEPDPPPAPTTGQVAFYTDVSALAPITVQVAGNTTRVTSSFASAPSCGDPGTGTVTLAPGSHAYSASNAAGVTWSGSVNITAGSCLRFRLTGTAPPPPPPPGGPSGNFTLPSTYFMDPSGTLAANTGNRTQGFTLNVQTTLVLRFVSEFPAQAAIIPASQLSAFTSGGSFTGFASFNRQIGTETVTLPPGQYFLAVRNASSSSNRFRAELDYDINLRGEAGRTFSFVDVPISGARTVSGNRGKLTHGFTIQSGFRYLLDGASIGVGSYIIDASELSNFQNNRTFRYYEDYGGEDGAFPGLWELKLPPGTYYLVVLNEGPSAMPITYTMERWRIN